MSDPHFDCSQGYGGRATKEEPAGCLEAYRPPPEKEGGHMKSNKTRRVARSGVRRQRWPWLATVMVVQDATMATIEALRQQGHYCCSWHR